MKIGMTEKARVLNEQASSWIVVVDASVNLTFIIIIIIKHIYRAHFCGMPQMRWRQQLHIK